MMVREPGLGLYGESWNGEAIGETFTYKGPPNTTLFFTFWSWNLLVFLFFFKTTSIKQGGAFFFLL